MNSKRQGSLLSKFGNNNNLRESVFAGEVSAREGASSSHQKYKIQIKISDGHKRVFYIRDEEEAKDICD